MQERIEKRYINGKTVVASAGTPHKIYLYIVSLGC
jgi:hypothetical protein